MLLRCCLVVVAAAAAAVLLLVTNACVGAAPAPTARGGRRWLLERQDLLALHGLRGALGVRAEYWPVKGHPCAWAGVVCRAGRVAELRLTGLRRTRAGAQRQGFAVDPLRELTALEVFDASGFPLPGRIPAWFGTGLPPSLAVLDLHSTSVNGELPADLGMSGNLTTLNLSGNSISGSIPATLFLIKGLKFLDISDNNLTGELPNVSILAGDGTGVFNASGNSLYGAIGDVLGPLLKRFRQVDVSRNYFSEVVGTGYGNSSDGAVHINMNCFSGSSQRSQGDCEAFYKRNRASLPEPPNASPSPSKKGVKWKHVLAGVLAGSAILVVFLLVALVFCLMRRGRRQPRGRGLEQNEEGIRSGRRSSSVNPVMLSSMAASPAANGTVKGLPTIVDDFTYEQLHYVTGGFGDDNLVKHGHSGDIYHGALESGFNVVVKKVDRKSSNKTLGELGFLAKNSHGRIVPLLGHLAVDDEELLVYKYMAKGDLTTALHKKPVDSEEGLQSLDWITRLKIAIGVAEALCFLHDECSPPLVHRDIQASSVLLDDKFEVCLGSLSDVCTQQSEGSRSFFSRMLRSSKSLDKNTSGPPASCSYDVYCFGKVLLELITGNFGVSGSNDTGSEEWLARTLDFIDAHEKEGLSNIVDPSLVVDEDHLEEVWAVSIVAKTCLNPKPSRRPLARYILKALENPLRVVREELELNSSRLRSTSSRSSWQFAFHGQSYRSSELRPTLGQSLARKQSVKSQGSDEEEEEEDSFSFKRASREILPDPSVELEENAVV
ncbi:probable LRR receptor-like serine/threonine-protein kinase At2g16250 [Oryza brachyantha]|uniref:probable LRR receptor-like serine/threonine-protein kinase At2g16250 n=1 Tax=Oryza brachyantha TaxID=4533 RepID=UPI001ADA819B|nr:probable LRR receptor-like serine/threonine-protein kinase At2g16250 [Oryza brachyantha]